jgi:membrane protease YdiL (CAAX protease family)
MAAGSLKEIMRLIKGGQLGLAIIAAPIFWSALWIYEAPRLEWGWPLSAPAQFLLLVVVYPVLEELVFRGALQGWLRSHSWGITEWRHVTVANAMTSVVFVLTHLFVNPVYLSIAVVLPSLIFGYFRDRYGRLRVPILLHVFYNAGYIWIFAGIPAG